MRLLRFVGTACLALCLVASTTAAEKEAPNAKKIVGTWEAVEGQVPPGSTVEFTRDGKLKATVKAEDKAFTIEGTYKVEGDALKATYKHDGEEKTHASRIKTLTGTRLVLEDQDGKVSEFKRKK